MSKTSTAWLATLLLPMFATAQGASRPSPLDPQAATAPLVHRSALGGYTRLAAEPPPVAWREANDAVARAGGWRALAREATAPQPADAAASAAGRGGPR
jgi:hypothetical protein